jgi:hypothetical protein
VRVICYQRDLKRVDRITDEGGLAEEAITTDIEDGCQTFVRLGMLVLCMLLTYAFAISTIRRPFLVECTDMR